MKVDLETGFNPYYNWTMFLIYITSLNRLLIVGFNPCYNWTMFLIEQEKLNVQRKYKFQSLLLVDNVSYLYNFFK